MILPILRYPDQRLKRPSIAVEVVPGRLVADMLETLAAHNGAGLAAPQVNAPLQLFVLAKDVCAEQQVFVNPSWRPTKGEDEPMILHDEGCLSLPGVAVEVRRFEHVIVEAQDITGTHFRLFLSGLAAVAVQHETDHLFGRLMTDDVSRHERRRIMAKLRQR